MMDPALPALDWDTLRLLVKDRYTGELYHRHAEFLLHICQLRPSGVTVSELPEFTKQLAQSAEHCRKGRSALFGPVCQRILECTLRPFPAQRSFELINQGRAIWAHFALVDSVIRDPSVFPCFPQTTVSVAYGIQKLIQNKRVSPRETHALFQWLCQSGLVQTLAKSMSEMNWGTFDETESYEQLIQCGLALCDHPTAAQILFDSGVCVNSAIVGSSNPETKQPECRPKIAEHTRVTLSVMYLTLLWRIITQISVKEPSDLVDQSTAILRAGQTELDYLTHLAFQRTISQNHKLQRNLWLAVFDAFLNQTKELGNMTMRESNVHLCLFKMIQELVPFYNEITEIEWTEEDTQMVSLCCRLLITLCQDRIILNDLYETHVISVITSLICKDSEIHPEINEETQLFCIQVLSEILSQSPIQFTQSDPFPDLVHFYLNTMKQMMNEAEICVTSKVQSLQSLIADSIQNIEQSHPSSISLVSMETWMDLVHINLEIIDRYPLTEFTVQCARALSGTVVLLSKHTEQSLEKQDSFHLCSESVRTLTRCLNREVSDLTPVVVPLVSSVLQSTIFICNSVEMCDEQEPSSEQPSLAQAFFESGGLPQTLLILEEACDPRLNCDYIGKRTPQIEQCALHICQLLLCLAAREPWCVSIANQIHSERLGCGIVKLITLLWQHSRVCIHHESETKTTLYCLCFAFDLFHRNHQDSTFEVRGVLKEISEYQGLTEGKRWSELRTECLRTQDLWESDKEFLLMKTDEFEQCKQRLAESKAQLRREENQEVNEQLSKLARELEAGAVKTARKVVLRPTAGGTLRKLNAEDKQAMINESLNLSETSQLVFQH